MPQYIQLNKETHEIIVPYILSSGFSDEMKRRIEGGRSYYDTKFGRFCIKPRGWEYVYVHDDFTETIFEVLGMEAPSEYEKLRQYRD